MKYIRVLYNECLAEGRPKLLREIKRNFQSPKTKRWRGFHQRRIHYYTMGREATNLLRDNGAQHITQVCDEPMLKRSGGVFSWNKLYLIREAVREHGEVIYTDLDILPRPGFDPDRLWDEVRSHPGMGRVLQMPIISYRRHSGYFWFRPRLGSGWDAVTPCVGFYGCFIYVTSEKLLDCFFDDYEEMMDRFNGRRTGDEQLITYSLDKRFGPLTIRQMHENFSPTCVSPRYSFLRRNANMDTSKFVLRHK